MSKKIEKELNNIDGIDKIIDNTFDKIKNMVDGNLIVGSTIKLTNSIFIIPISKVSVGLISGGGELPKAKKKSTVSVGSSTGFNIIPIGFVIVNNGVVDYLSVTVVDNTTNKLFEALLNLSERIINSKGESDEENKGV